MIYNFWWFFFDFFREKLFIFWWKINNFGVHFYIILIKKNETLIYKIKMWFFVVVASAGGLGVLLNANRLELKLALEAPHASVKAVIDSSWQLDLPYSYLCSETTSSNSVDDATDGSADNDEGITRTSVAADSCIINKIFNNSIRLASIF